eukprot:86684_1
MNHFHAHPILPSPHHLKHNHQQQHSKEASPASTADPDLSIPMTMNDPFSDYYYDEEEVMVRSLRPRRGSDCGIRSSCHTEEKKKISVMKGNEIGDILDALEESRSDSAAAADDSSKKELEEKQMDPLERFGIEHYEHITPSLIRVLEAFLDLEKRSTFGSSLTLAATSMMSWFFNGYIANKLYASSAASLSMDGTLSYLVQWVSDLLWIPPTYTMNEEEAAIPTQEEMDALRVEARQCLQQMFEEYVGDNVPKIIGQRKQLERCMMKFWRFMQQDKLLKHLAFSVLDALLQDLFVDKVSRRYQRRAWIADRKRKREEKQKKREHKHQPQKHNKQAKIDEEDVVVMQQQQQQKVVELRRPQSIPLPTKKKKKKKEEIKEEEKEVEAEVVIKKKECYFEFLTDAKSEMQRAFVKLSNFKQTLLANDKVGLFLVFLFECFYSFFEFDFDSKFRYESVELTKAWRQHIYQTVYEQFWSKMDGAQKFDEERIKLKQASFKLRLRENVLRWNPFLYKLPALTENNATQFGALFDMLGAIDDDTMDMSPLKPWIDQMDLRADETYCMLLYLWLILDVELPCAPYKFIQLRKKECRDAAAASNEAKSPKQNNNNKQKKHKQKQNQTESKKKKNNKKQNQQTHKRNKGNKKKQKTKPVVLFKMGGM